MCLASIGVLFFAPWSHALDLVDALIYNAPKSMILTGKLCCFFNLLQYETDQLNLGIAQGNLLPTISLSGNVTRKINPLGR